SRSIRHVTKILKAPILGGEERSDGDDSASPTAAPQPSLAMPLLARRSTNASSPTPLIATASIRSPKSLIYRVFEGENFLHMVMDLYASVDHYDRLTTFARAFSQADALWFPMKIFRSATPEAKDLLRKMIHLGVRAEVRKWSINEPGNLYSSARSGERARYLLQLGQIRGASSVSPTTRYPLQLSQIRRANAVSPTARKSQFSNQIGKSQLDNQINHVQVSPSDLTCAIVPDLLLSDPRR
ncbi:hypothetical protein U1Q18_022320, partial [Sarracenia purpurea var. burkii]